MGRAPCCDKASVKRGPWSPEEDAKLKDYIEKQGTGGNWIALPQKAGLNRCGKSCRLRWLNYLRPNIKHGEFSEHEDRIICTLFANIGSRWSIIAAQLPGRTDNDIKNYWNTKLKKKLAAMAGGYYTNPPSSNLFYGGASLAPEQQHSHFSLFSPTIPTPPVPSTSTSDSFYELSPFNSSSSSSATTLQPDKLVSSGINAYVHEAASCSASSVHHCQFDHQQMSDSNLQGFSSPYYGNNEILMGINQETMNYESANPLDYRYYYGIEEIKQLISSNSSSSCSPPSSVATSKNINSSNSYGSFLLDVNDKSTGGVANLANTSEEGFLYYYY